MAPGALVLVLIACGSAPLTPEEFCALSRQGDLETTRLFAITPGTEEFQAQLEIVRDINDRLFSNPPAAIDSVARELAPLLRQEGADNARVTELLNQVGDYVAQSCPAS